MLQVLGKIAVVTPGTLVRVTDTVASVDTGGHLNTPTRFTCQAALFQALQENVGRVYIGMANMNRTTRANTAAVLAIPATTSLPSFGISILGAPAGVDLSELFIDADNAGDGVLLTLLIA